MLRLFAALLLLLLLPALARACDATAAAYAVCSADKRCSGAFFIEPRASLRHNRAVFDHLFRGVLLRAPANDSAAIAAAACDPALHGLLRALLAQQRFCEPLERFSLRRGCHCAHAASECGVRCGRDVFYALHLLPYLFGAGLVACVVFVVYTVGTLAALQRRTP